VGRLVVSYRQTLAAGGWWLATAVLLFLAGGVLGYVATAADPEAMLSRIGVVLTLLREVGERVTRAESPLERAWPIFLNNLRSVFVMMLGGLFFGLVPLAGSLTNGAIVGVVAALGARVSPVAVSPALLFLSLAPHGIFELPALWLGAAWGMKLGLGWLAPAAAGRRNETFLRTAREAVQVFVLATVLLFIAALVEANITAQIVRSLVEAMPG
jgi:stage II sporulation protein M